jgi:cytoskeletal protein CcmA (bactofilin family)
MALKDLVSRSDRTEERGQVEASRASAPPPRTVAPPTSIDASTQLVGQLRCQETVRIDGKLKGKLHCDKSVIVGQAAIVEADVEGDEVIVAGSVSGNILASRKITLSKTARVIGDLTTPGIVIEEGAKLEGRIMIGSNETASQKSPQPEKSTADTAPEKAPEKHANAPAPGRPRSTTPPPAR